MKKTGRYVAIEPHDDKRKKYHVIMQGLHGVLSNGAFYCRKSQTTLISQIIHWPGQNPEGTHDDVIETVARGVMSLERGFVPGGSDRYLDVKYDDLPELEYARGAP